MSASAEAPRLAQLVEGARAAGRLALDTEFIGEGRYLTLLCVIQLAIPEGSGADERIVVLDPLADGFEGAPLASLLADPQVQVVVHAGRQDVALVRRRFGTEVTNVFDTQVAAGFAGMGAQSSYESLLSGLLGLRVAKTASFTRWDARPLSREQLAYAREDVVHLLDLADELERRLRGLGRLQWAVEECEVVAVSSDQRDPETIFLRLPRLATLNAKARALAHELVIWREQSAERLNRPVQSVLSDAALVEIARRGPSSRSELQKIRGIGGAASGRRGEELLEAIQRGRTRPPETAPVGSRVRSPRPDDPPLVALAESLMRARARESGLAYELLATRAELQEIITAARSGGPEPQIRTLTGWRRELAGRELLDLLAGALSLSVSGTGAQLRVSVEADPGRPPAPR